MAATLKINVDLCPKKPNPLFLEVGNTKVTVEITVESKKPVPSIILKRLQDKAAAPVIKQYQSVIQEEVLTLQAKIQDLVKKQNTEGAAKMAAETQLSVQNACKALQSAVNVAVKKQLEVDAKNDRDLLEAQVVVVLKGALITLKIGVAAARIGASHGGDVSAYFSLAKSVYEMVKLVREATKSEMTVRKELDKALDVYLAAAAKNPKDVAKMGVKVEELRKKHLTKVTGLRHDMVNLSKKTDELEKKMKGAKDLKNGVAIGAKVMKLKTNLRMNYEEYSKVEKIAEEMAAKAKAGGIKPDDRTLIQKWKATSPKDALKLAMEMGGIGNEIMGLITG